MKLGLGTGWGGLHRFDQGRQIRIRQPKGMMVHGSTYTSVHAIKRTYKHVITHVPAHFPWSFSLFPLQIKETLSSLSSCIQEHEGVLPNFLYFCVSNLSLLPFPKPISSSLSFDPTFPYCFFETKSTKFLPKQT